MIADATHDEDLDVVVEAGLEQEVRIPPSGRDRRDVELVGTVQSDRRDARARILLVEDDLLGRRDVDFGHGELLASRKRIRREQFRPGRGDDDRSWPYKAPMPSFQT